MLLSCAMCRCCPTKSERHCLLIQLQYRPSSVKLCQVLTLCDNDMVCTAPHSWRSLSVKLHLYIVTVVNEYIQVTSSLNPIATPKKILSKLNQIHILISTYIFYAPGWKPQDMSKWESLEQGKILQFVTKNNCQLSITGREQSSYNSIMCCPLVSMHVSYVFPWAPTSLAEKLPTFYHRIKCAR